MLQQQNEDNSLETYIGDVGIKDLIDVFLSRVGKEGLDCVEKLGQRSLRIYFKDGTDVNRFLEEPLIVKGTELYFFRVGEKLKTVFVKGLPFNLPEKLLHDAIKKYGKVRSIGYERYVGYRPICTGTRILKMKLNNSIPNFLRVGKYMAIISYKNQVKVCRRCGGNNHFAKECNTRREDFQEGFPVHTRPVAAKTGRKLGSSNKGTNTEVQHVVSTVSGAISLPGQSFNPSNDASVFKSSNVTFTSVAQRLNGLRLDGINRNSDCIMDSSAQVENSTPPLARAQKKGKQNGCIESPCPAGSTQNWSASLDLCSKQVHVSAPEGISNVAANLCERNQCATTVTKRKKKKKKKSSK